MKPLQEISMHYYEAFHRKKWREGIHLDLSGLSVAEAYEVQNLVTERRIRDGERTIGYKVGCTSAAIRKQFGFDEPICGRLFHPHVWKGGGCLDWTAFANCAIEPEMVLRMGSDLGGTDIPDEELLSAIGSVSAGIEIHDFTFWQGSPTLQELICSGGIHAGLVLGSGKVSPWRLAFCDETFGVYRNECLVTEAPAREILGGPLRSLRWLVNFLDKQGRYLEEGSLVIPGSPTELVVIDEDCRLRVSIEQVGELTMEFREGAARPC